MKPFFFLMILFPFSVFSAPQIPPEISAGFFQFDSQVDYLLTRIQENVSRKTTEGEARFQELMRLGNQCESRLQGVWACIHFHKSGPTKTNLIKTVKKFENLRLKFESPRAIPHLISEAEALNTWMIQQRVWWGSTVFNSYEWVQTREGEAGWLRRDPLFEAFQYESPDSLKVRHSATTTQGNILTTDYLDVVLERAK